MERSVPEYTSVIRMVFVADSIPEAEMTAYAAVEAIEENLVELDHGDEVEVTYVGPQIDGTTPSELIASLERTRNTLILTKSQRCWEVAKELDKLVFALERGDYTALASYDHGRFFEIAQKVLDTVGEVEDD